MRKVHNQAGIEKIERERALVGTYIDRVYNPEKIGWVLEAREGFDEHARDAWHLLIPVKEGYGVDSWIQPEEYSVALAASIIDELEIAFPDLPCVVFRAGGNEFYFLKLGGKSKDQFFEEIGRIADIARKCQQESKAEGMAFRDYVNMQVANHLRRRKLLSATRSALPALSALLGGIVDFKDLV
ncbi:hypothetical protein [Paracoccus beibuensis]|uniref:hypothetical protein n=1 Tax=Paracoccus beibuensis TaxID=547602 RepID=UPI00223FAE95|nr:hypothetical protein [Paracoccus beibuensis]